MRKTIFFFFTFFLWIGLYLCRQQPPSPKEIAELPQRISKVYPHLKGDELAKFSKLIVDNWNYTHTRPQKKIQDVDPVPEISCQFFECDRSVRPTSADKLRFCDIDVVAAVGDSITAGFGADASTIFGVFTEYRGYSWSVGGDPKKDFYGQEMFTVPKMLKNYNPNLYGFASGTGGNTDKNARFNQAITGAIAQEIPGQVRTLISRMKSDPKVNWNNDWKLITLWVGGNDLCAVCKGNSQNTPESYKAYIKEAIQIIYDEIPRVFVNLVQAIDVTRLSVLSTGFCRLLHIFECYCGTGCSKDQQIASDAFKRYNELLETIPQEFPDHREDFAVVCQPLFVETGVPLKNGEPDMEYFAPDCFHFSVIGHEASAVALWNNMLEKVGEKRREWHPDEEILCPTQNDYLATYRNS